MASGGSRDRRSGQRIKFLRKKKNLKADSVKIPTSVIHTLSKYSCLLVVTYIYVHTHIYIYI